ncbi:hypothetical protein CsSME_00003984 [Camellia sinensis var. sinensis]
MVRIVEVRFGSFGTTTKKSEVSATVRIGDGSTQIPRNPQRLLPTIHHNRHSDCRSDQLLHQHDQGRLGLAHQLGRRRCSSRPNDLVISLGLRNPKLPH